MNKSTQLAETYLERPQTLQWQRRRLELLQPEQEQRMAKRRWETVPYVLLVALIFIFAFAYMCLDAKIGVAGLKINDLEAQIKEQQTLSLRTELEIGVLSSLSRIENYAKLHLGMVYPDIGAVHYLDQQVSNMLAEELAVLAEAEPPTEQEVQETPLLKVWAELVNKYVSGAAMAMNGEHRL
ncbi:MAG: hypothetical protein FWG61_00270 [Firmicutes bacterium]|nr:hypothetical protein [Bacillota bacterium]